MATGLQIHEFSDGLWKALQVDTRPHSKHHRSYLWRYLNTLGCKWAVEELIYIDRDYHEEFSEFYGTTPLRPQSTCRRAHFFDASVGKLDEASLMEHASGGADVLAALRKGYLGCIVLRPKPIAPFGRTLLRCYPPSDGDKIRHFETARTYKVHLCGLELCVDAVPWQQQDEGVSACAGVSLWSVLQSAAPIEGIAVPTTTRVARAATKYSLPLGRALPPGLDVGQLCQGIRELGLAPSVLEGDIFGETHCRFSLPHFREIVGVLVRGGLPVILVVSSELSSPDHAVVLVGYQASAKLPTPGKGVIGSAVDEMPVVYVHDDNLGPGVRHELSTWHDTELGVDVATMRPKPADGGAAERKLPLVPCSIIGAFPHKLRLSPAELLEAGHTVASGIKQELEDAGNAQASVLHDTAFVHLTEYMRVWLALAATGSALGKARVRLQSLHPLPRYLGVVRLLIDGAVLADALWDTTTPPRRPHLLGWVAFNTQGHALGSKLAPDVLVDAR